MSLSMTVLFLLVILCGENRVSVTMTIPAWIEEALFYLIAHLMAYTAR